MFSRWLIELGLNIDGTTLLGIVPRAIASVCAFWAVLALAGVLDMNKGAKFNRSIGLIAAGLGLFGFARIQDFAALLGWARFPRTAAFAEALGALLILLGALYARGIFRRLLK